MHDRQFKRYFTFLILFSLVLFIVSVLFCCSLSNAAKTMLLCHDESVVSGLLEQGVSENVIARAYSDAEPAVHLSTLTGTSKGYKLLQKLGLRTALDTKFLPHLHRFRTLALRQTLMAVFPMGVVLLGISLLFLHRREILYRRASSIIDSYTKGDYSRRLAQTGEEGTVYRMLSSVDRLATMLQTQNAAEQKSKLFLRNTISDISHQLKTPLAALSMYQEIMENETYNPAVIQQFTAKTGLALKRMERLIQSMLKITRLDAGSVVFEKHPCPLPELILQAASELTTRAINEDKTLIIDEPDTNTGSFADTLFCDAGWTAEAIGNIIKNALDHTSAKSTIRITYETSPLTGTIQISDNGEGIAPEDIHHIFKRFYRGSRSSDTQGIGLGLSLAKSIVDGQGGTISVQSTPHQGTTFTLMFPAQ